MPERSLLRVEVVGELTLHPFEIRQTRAVRELVEHPGGNQVLVGIRSGLFILTHEQRG